MRNCQIKAIFIYSFLTLRGHEKVDVLQDVKEELVAAVFDALAAPADLTRHLMESIDDIL